jgi:UDP-glucose 4-epimerase
MKILVTGGSGFIGAWIIRRLLTGGHDVRVFDINKDRSIVRSIAGKDAEIIDWCAGDIRDGDAVIAAAQGCDTTIHLAAVLTPACQERPRFGAEIIVIGTLNVFEAARRHQMSKVVYASSAGVFGPKDGRTPFPITHYGAFKLATEGCARAYFEDHGISSVGFRPFVVYGPGREVGLTAGPSLACRAAAEGRPYTFAYTGPSDMLFVDDVAAAFEAAMQRPIRGAYAFNLLGEVATVEQVMEGIRRHVPQAALAESGPTLPTMSPERDLNLASVLGDLPHTTLSDGLARTIDFYRQT